MLRLTARSIAMDADQTFEGSIVSRRYPGVSRGLAKWRRTLTIVLALSVVTVGVYRELRDPAPGALPERVSGRPDVIDGDSLRVSGVRIRLVGIDAPEGRQMCERDGVRQRCGDQARDHLRQLIKRAGGAVSCQITRADQHGRGLASCTAGDVALNERMVRDGFAVAFGRRHRDLERQAQSANRGLWAGTFQRPSEWRDQNPRH